MARADDSSDVSDAEKSSVEWKQAMRDLVEEVGLGCVYFFHPPPPPPPLSLSLSALSHSP